MNKKFILVFLLLFIIQMTVPTNIYAKEDQLQISIEYINEIRENMELPSLSINDKLNKMSESHSKYMYYNNVYSIIEESGKLYYRGRYPWDRALYYSYDKPYIFEYINKSGEDHLDNIRNYIDNPYSRITFFDPLYTEIGMSNYDKYYTYNLGGRNRKNTYKVTYPYNNQNNIPINWTNRYSLNPYEGTKLSSEECGYPITLSYYADDYIIKEVKVNKINIINLKNSKEIKYRILTPNEDRNINNSIIILPTEKYEQNTTYSVDVDLDISFTNGLKKEYIYNGKFKTVDNQYNILSDPFLNRGDFMKEIVKALGYRLNYLGNNSFIDVDNKSELGKYIYTAYNNNIISGYSDNTFRPEVKITKEQVYIILIRAYEDKYKKIELRSIDKELDLIDKEKISPWALTNIYKANKLGIMSIENNTLNPKDYITKDELTKIMEKYNKVLR